MPLLSATKQTRSTGHRKRSHGNSETNRDRDKDRGGENDRKTRTTSRKAQEEDGQPKRAPSLEPTRPKKPPRKPLPPEPEPEPEPEPDPDSGTKQTQYSPIDDTLYTDYALSVPSADSDDASLLQTQAESAVEPAAASHWNRVDISGHRVVALVDSEIEESFVSESFAKRLPVKAKSTDREPTYYNALPSKKRKKVSISFVDGGRVFEDVILYIVPGNMPHELDVVLGSQIASQFRPASPTDSGSVADQSPYEPSLYQSQERSRPPYSSSPLAFRPRSVGVSAQPYQYSVSSSHTRPSYAVSPQQVQSNDYESVDAQTHQPALQGRRGDSSPQREQSLLDAEGPPQATGAPWQGNERAIEDAAVGPQNIDYGYESMASTSEVRTENAEYFENENYALGSHNNVGEGQAPHQPAGSDAKLNHTCYDTSQHYDRPSRWKYRECGEGSSN